MNRTDIINTLIKKYELTRYLEIGVRDCTVNFDKINCKHKVSVDPQPVKSVTYKTTSDIFFKKNKNIFDLIFIDGLHTRIQCNKDVENSLSVLSDNGFIVIHDCNPEKKEHTKSYQEYLKTRGVWNGTVYKSFIEQKEKHKNSDYSFFVVNTDYGCGIITKNIKPFGAYNVILQDEISWEFFNENRKKLLNLISIEEFKKLIGAEI